MKYFLKLAAILSLTLAFGAGSVLAQDFEKGLAAYNAGDYATALKEWRWMAEEGNVGAQFNLGVMYEKGEGVLEDNIRVHMWYNIASANSHKKAGELRKEIAGQMTSADISEAQKMARKCMGSNYQNCVW